MPRTAIIGYGELGQQFKIHLEQTGKFELLFFDDIAYSKNIPDSFEFSSFQEDKYSLYQFYIALGYKHLEKKKEILSLLNTLGRKSGVFIHNSTYVNSTASIGQGTFIYPMCTIDKEVQINEGCLINNGVIISHDSTVGECSYISPGVVISGNVNIGSCSFLGSGTVVSNNVNIGDNVVIGAGTVVTKDIPANANVIGNPMRILSEKIKLV